MSISSLVCYLLFFTLSIKAHSISNNKDSDRHVTAQAPAVSSRKLGNDYNLPISPSPSPSSADLKLEEDNNGPTIKTRHQIHHHRPIDRSVAGGGVILGGLATTFLVAIFCYIRATRRRSSVAAVEPGSSRTGSVVETGSPSASTSIGKGRVDDNDNDNDGVVSVCTVPTNDKSSEVVV